MPVRGPGLWARTLQSFLAGTVPNSHVATMQAEIVESLQVVGVEEEDMC